MNSLLLSLVLGACTVETVGDLDGNCVINLLDIDLLVPAVYSHEHNLHFDLTDDGLVDYDDVMELLSIAGHRDGWGTAYLAGDTNWHGEVDARDLNILGRSWGQSNPVWWGDCHLDPPWCYVRPGGDFDANGVVDAADLNLLAVNWQKRLVRPVPEPSTFVLILLGGVTWKTKRNRLRTYQPTGGKS